MDVELPPSRWVRMAGKGEDCSVPQWELSWGETVTVYTDGVDVGEHFHEDLPALRALALASLAAVEYAEHQVASDAGGALSSVRLAGPGVAPCDAE